MPVTINLSRCQIPTLTRPDPPPSPSSRRTPSTFSLTLMRMVTTATMSTTTNVSTKASADANLASTALSYGHNKNDNNTHSSSNHNHSNHPQPLLPTCAFIHASALPAVCATPVVPARSTLRTRTRPPRPSPHRCAIALTIQIPAAHWVSVSPGLHRRHSKNAEWQRRQLQGRRQGVRSIPRLAPRASPLLHMGQLGIVPAGSLMLTASGARRSCHTARRSCLADGPGGR